MMRKKKISEWNRRRIQANIAAMKEQKKIAYNPWIDYGEGCLSRVPVKKAACGNPGIIRPPGLHIG